MSAHNIAKTGKHIFFNVNGDTMERSRALSEDSSPDTRGRVQKVFSIYWWGVCLAEIASVASIFFLFFALNCYDLHVFSAFWKGYHVALGVLGLVTLQQIFMPFVAALVCIFQRGKSGLKTIPMVSVVVADGGGFYAHLDYCLRAQRWGALAAVLPYALVNVGHAMARFLPRLSLAQLHHLSVVVFICWKPVLLLCAGPIAALIFFAYYLKKHRDSFWPAFYFSRGGGESIGADALEHGFGEDAKKYGHMECVMSVFSGCLVDACATITRIVVPTDMLDVVARVDGCLSDAYAPKL